MTYLHIIILLLINTFVNCCDEKDCRYGTAIATQVSTSIGAIGAISCAVTFGIGCLVAAGGAIAAAATTAGSELCGECSETSALGGQTIPLEKLDKIMKEQKENFQNLSQGQINNRLENLKWFQKLASGQKKLLSGQAVLKLNQQKILKDLTTLVSKSKQIQSSIDMTQLINLYGDSISNLLHIQSLFDDMNKDDLGGIIDDFNSDEFIEATNHFRYGSKRSIRDVIKMLTSGHPLNSQSIWKVDSSYCSKSHTEFFSSLLYSSFCFRRIALEMEGNSMSKREAVKFENDVKNVKRYTITIMFLLYQYPKIIYF